ncbi:hypothetical protein ACTOB_005248 [Actinoplanes oblitus]|uniref:Leucine-rich repeat domain-containing protein n=1 Tax=Actinoplanes oblitus TaxID=3040509 RepID=A0ABY8W8A2_9ACTN|nr:hypothetical protein [Actinoplanes oblitus]WIM93273.1 hypothetical protein ACTOB_005248 [Actinoplanes oblitus]
MPANTWNFRSLRGIRRPPSESGTAEFDFGDGPRRVVPWTATLDLRGLTPASGPVDWTALDHLPQLRGVTWSGPDRGLAGALAGRPRITYLDWFDARGEVDLRATAVARLRITGRELGAVRLPASATSLLLQELRPDLEVAAHDDGHGLALNLTSAAELVVPPGVRRAPEVRLNVGGELSVRQLEQFTDLRQLTVDFEAPPGRLTGLPLLARHPGLQRLCLINACRLDPATFPDLPALLELEVIGTRAEVAAGLGERFHGATLPELTIRYARSGESRSAPEA